MDKRFRASNPLPHMNQYGQKSSNIMTGIAMCPKRDAKDGDFPRRRVFTNAALLGHFHSQFGQVGELPSIVADQKHLTSNLDLNLAI